MLGRGLAGGLNDPENWILQGKNYQISWLVGRGKNDRKNRISFKYDLIGKSMIEYIPLPLIAASSFWYS